MKYSSNDHITAVKDVEKFFDYLLHDCKLNFHPDDRFENYINIETKEQTFTPSECELFNKLMDEAFEVCEKEGADIYEIGADKLFNLLNRKVA